MSESVDENTRVFLSLGSNLDSRVDQIAEATRRAAKKGLLICKCSSLYETQPVEVLCQPDFLNCCCEVRTDLDAESLLEACLTVEREMGRLRTEPKGPRVIDIDILFFGHEILDSRRLSIPHPAISRRRFVLVPMVEIAPEFRHPISGLTMQTMLQRCSDRSAVKLVNPFERKLQASDR